IAGLLAKFQLHALALGGGQLVAFLGQAVLQPLGIAFQGLQLAEIGAVLLLGFRGITLGGIGFEQRHLVVQDGNLHFGKSRGGHQGGSQENQLGQFTHVVLQGWLNQKVWPRENWKTWVSESSGSRSGLARLKLSGPSAVIQVRLTPAELAMLLKSMSQLGSLRPFCAALQLVSNTLPASRNRVVRSERWSLTNGNGNSSSTPPWISTLPPKGSGSVSGSAMVPGLLPV